MRHPRLRDATLAALIAATTVAAIVLFFEVVLGLAPYESGVHVPWWALAAGFALTEVFVIHAHIRGSAHSLSLSELPLVIGLLLSDPSDVVIAAVAGPAAVLLLTRGQGPVRLLFNLAQFALTASVAAIVLHWLAPPQALTPTVWAATFAAVAVSAAVGALLVFCAIGLSEGGIPSRRMASILGGDLIVSLTNASLALAGAMVVAADPRAALLLLPPVAVLLVGYRAYTSERAKHQSLEFLYGVAHSLSRGDELDGELLDLLRRARTRFRVRTAELVLLHPDAEALRTAVRGDGRDEAMAPVADFAARALRAAVIDDRAVQVSRESSPEPLARYLAERGIEQALVAPVRGETRLSGVMILGDRLGSAVSFTDEDLRLFETLANHAGLSLEFDRLEREAQTDPLTGLSNRGLFLHRVEVSLKRAGGSVTVLFLDLDDFKAINDGTGHAAGDAVLVAAARRIEKSLRPGDVAARIGGDEFAVLLEDVDDHHGELVAGRMLDLLSDPVSVDGEPIGVRSSVGIASVASGSLDAATLMHHADVAMYRAKEAGKNQVRVWAPEMVPAGEGPGHEELLGALAEGAVLAHFQPIVELDGGRVVAAEALARWHHPRHGMLGPASFVPVAEAAGVAAAIDREMLAQSCAAAAAGAFPVVHVNLSALDGAMVREALEDSGLDPARLVIELSERTLATAPAAELEHLRTIGVRVAFDDFGTGEEALELLRGRPVDVLKIAKPFVDGAGRTAHDRALISMLLQIGGLFGLEVIAEGIEREDQREALDGLGCQVGQGYLLGRPLPLGASAVVPA